MDGARTEMNRNQERGKPGFNVNVSGRKSEEEINLPYKRVPKVKIEQKGRYAEGEGTIPLGKVSLTLGGAYDESKTKVSHPGNKIGIPDSLQQFIYKKISGGLGYQVNPDLKISGFIDRERMTGGKGKNKQTVQVSGKLLGGNFVGSLSNQEGEKIGKFSLRIPFAHDGKIKPRGRKAGY
jgi:hypothetical protein